MPAVGHSVGPLHCVDLIEACLARAAYTSRDVPTIGPCGLCAQRKGGEMMLKHPTPTRGTFYHAFLFHGNEDPGKRKRAINRS